MFVGVFCWINLFHISVELLIMKPLKIPLSVSLLSDDWLIFLSGIGLIFFLLTGVGFTRALKMSPKQHILYVL
jgi:hypothetical protein